VCTPSLSWSAHFPNTLDPWIAVKPSQSTYIPVRGLQYHIRSWGNPDAPKVIMLHGAQECSASWQFVVDALKSDWHLIAPDWRGYGLSAWTGAQTYWQQNLVGDLNVILNRYSPDEPALLFTHSLGGNVASVLAGLRPERVRRLVNVEGYNVPTIPVEDLHKRYSAWLDSTSREQAPERAYKSYEAFAERMCKKNPRVTPERALFFAQNLCKDVPGGGVTLRSDPAYGNATPISYRLDEQSTYWSRITAPVLWVEGGASDWLHDLLKTGEYEKRVACFRNLTRERFELAGHNIHHEEPERLAEVCERFLLQS
jgi:pimeloyl-ACP methyl ester carboxylesterase